MKFAGHEGFVPLRDGAIAAQPDLDLRAWLRALREIPTEAMTESDFKAWIEGPLRRFFPFDRFHGVHGRLSGRSVHMQSIISCGDGPNFLASRAPVFDIRARRCIEWWISHRRGMILDRTIAINAAGARIVPNELEIDDMSRLALGAMAQHALIDPYTKAGFYFGFTGVPKTRSSQTLAALELIAPVVYALYLRTKEFTEPAPDLTSLTDRQRDLADLAALGLSDKAIASRLGISEHTVGNHFRAIYARLGVSKRGQLVALLK